MKLTSQGTNTNTFPLFENLVTFSDRFNVVNSKMKSWDGNIIHTKENSYININDNPNNLLKSSTGTTINPRDKQYYDPALSISLTADSNKGLKNYIDSLMTSANTKKVNGQSISSADLSSTVNWFPDRISEIKLNQAIGSANTTKILILSQGAANIHGQPGRGGIGHLHQPAADLPRIAGRTIQIVGNGLRITRVQILLEPAHRGIVIVGSRIDDTVLRRTEAHEEDLRRSVDALGQFIGKADVGRYLVGEAPFQSLEPVLVEFIPGAQYHQLDILMTRRTAALVLYSSQAEYAPVA